MFLPFQGILFRFHVSFLGCTSFITTQWFQRFWGSTWLPSFRTKTTSSALCDFFCPSLEQLLVPFYANVDNRENNTVPFKQPKYTYYLYDSARFNQHFHPPKPTHFDTDWVFSSPLWPYLQQMRKSGKSSPAIATHHHPSSLYLHWKSNQI